MKYFGATASILLNEFDKINESQLKEEELKNSRWFDYRLTTSPILSCLFSCLYSDLYIEYYKKTVDIETAHIANPFKTDSIFETKHAASLWSAREAADTIGCKYDFYLRTVFEVFLSRGWQTLPRPDQIYSEELSIDINRMWKQRCFDILQLAENKFYLASAFADHPDQIAYHDFLIEHIRLSRNLPIMLAGVMKHRKILPYEVAVAAFGEGICNSVISSY